MNAIVSNADFAKLGVNDIYTNALSALGITTPTAVQERVIPQIFAEKNIVFQSETGTGKTFAYLLPILSKIDEESKNVQVLILSPTYELASQINMQIKKISSAKTVLCIGGATIHRQVEALKTRPQIVIGNVGRILELIRLQKIKINALRFLVLDEADRILAKETFDFSKELLGLCIKSNDTINVIACSATIKEKTIKTIENLCDKKIVFEKLPTEDILRTKIEHWALFAERRDKIDTLRSLIKAEMTDSTKMVVFTSRADQVDNITSKLLYKKINCVSLHAKMGKMERKNAIDKFRSGKASVLITSDLSARGLDIADVTHIIQMDLSSDETFFIHRAGRTGRQGKKGINIVIGDEREMRMYASLEKKLKIVVYPKMLFKGKIEKCS